MSDLVDEFDDVLGHHVTRRRLAADDDHPRRTLAMLAALDPIVQMNRVQHVEQLALVLVDSLDLHVEQHIRIDDDPRLRLDNSP